MANQTATEWDLGHLFADPNDPKLTAAWREADGIIRRLTKRRGRLAQLTPAQFAVVIQDWETVAVIFHRLGLFASLWESTRIGDPVATRFDKAVTERLVANGQKIIFLEVELAKLPPVKWQEYQAAPALVGYRQFLRHRRREAEHTLSEPEEKILAEKSQTSWQALSHIFNLTTSTLEFTVRAQKLTLDELLTQLRDPDARVRRRAGLALHRGLETNRRTTPAVYNALILDKTVNDRLRRYDFPEQRRFEADDVEPQTVAAMVQAVTEAYPTVERYYDLKKRILKIKRLHWWDRYAPLPQPKTAIAIEEAKKLVLGAYANFSPELGAIVREMYASNHIDWLPSATKRGGAFCAAAGQNTYPYVLLNYTGDLRDVTTLAHELGHAIHDILAQKNHRFFEFSPSLALAEIASTFGESLVIEHLMASDLTALDRRGLLMAKIEDHIATVFRQIAMFQFEQAVHQRRRQNGELSSDELDDLWHDYLRAPFGQSVIFTPEHKNTWMYIPHIIDTPFYVYAYAFAQLSTLALVRQYQRRGAAFAPTYLALLAAGGSLTPQDCLKRAGLNITSRHFWADGLGVIDRYVDELAATI